MVKNEWHVEISAHMGSIEFIPYFTLGECSAFSDVAQRVELYREHFEFASAFYDALGSLGFIEEIR